MYFVSKWLRTDEI